MNDRRATDTPIVPSPRRYPRSGLLPRRQTLGIWEKTGDQVEVVEVYPRGGSEMNRNRYHAIPEWLPHLGQRDTVFC